MVAILIVDRVGRKSLLLAGLAGVVISLLVIGGAFLVPGLSGIISWVTLVGLMLYVASFAVSFGPLLWVMLPEIFPVRARGAGAGLSSLTNWGANFVVACLSCRSSRSRAGRPYSGGSVLSVCWPASSFTLWFLKLGVVAWKT